MSLTHTLHVNIYAADGTGRTTLAEALSSHLRRRGVRTELVPDYVKELHYDGVLWSTEQFLITAEQLRRESRTRVDVSVVIVDAPLPLGLLSANEECRPALATLLQHLTKHWPKFNILLERGVPLTETLSDKDAPVRVVGPQALVRRTLVEWAGAPDATLEGDDYVFDGVISQILARVAELRQEAGSYEAGFSEAGDTIVGKQQR